MSGGLEKSSQVGGPEEPKAVEWPIFLAYRRKDGRPAAEWLYQRLQGLTFAKGGETVALSAYLDHASPGVGDWTAVHRDALERARALVVVLTPGLAARLGPAYPC